MNPNSAMMISVLRGWNGEPGVAAAPVAARVNAKEKEIATLQEVAWAMSKTWNPASTEPVNF